MFQVLAPANLSKMQLRNRFIRSATYDGSADETGGVTDRSVKLIEGLAAGGVGLVVTGYAFVSREGQAVPWQLGAHCDEMIPGLKRLVKAAHERDAKIALQIAHSGINSLYLSRVGQVARGPSQIADEHPHGGGTKEANGSASPSVRPASLARGQHRAMTVAEIVRSIDDFVAAAGRAREAGFDAVQLHGAHGYLMSQFLSPITNLRQDQWGGDPERRRRYHVETLTRVRAAVGPDFPVMIKLGIADDDEGGLSLGEGIAALKAMVELGLDAVEISGGIGSGKRGSIRAFNDASYEESYYRESAAGAKKAVSVPLAVVGGIRSLEKAEEIVAYGDGDFVSLCRPLIREPGLIQRWLSGDYRRAACISCTKCLALPIQGKPLECVEERQARESRVL